MLIRPAFVLLLLLPTAAAAQDLDTAVSAVVRISGTRNGSQLQVVDVHPRGETLARTIEY